MPDLAAHAAKQGNALVRAFADRLAAAGKAPKVIRIAGARELLVVANAVLRTGQPFGKIEAEIARPPPQLLTRPAAPPTSPQRREVENQPTA